MPKELSAGAALFPGAALIPFGFTQPEVGGRAVGRAQGGTEDTDRNTQSSALGGQVSTPHRTYSPRAHPWALGDKQAHSARGFPYPGTTNPSLELPAMQLQLGARGKAPTSATPAEPTWQNLQASNIGLTHTQVYICTM